MYESLYLIPISEEEAIKHFTYLQHAHTNDYTTDKKENQESSTRIGASTNGNKASNYFFQSVRLRTNYRNKGTYEGWIQANGVEKLQQLALTYSKKKSIEECKEHDLQSVLHLRVGSINQFKPRVAACLYDYFKPTSVLDFCAGWGDRCVAAMAKGIHYTGIDTNVELQTPYSNMITFYTQLINKKECTVPTVKIHFQPSETFDFSTVSYDMVLTSPPYFDLEKYEHMPSYETFEVWISSFLKVVVAKAWQHLRENGWLCLNLPSKSDNRKHTKYDLFTPVQTILGEPTKKIHMMLQYRAQNKEQANNCEYIYCWQKTVTVISTQPQLQTQSSSSTINTQSELFILRDENRKLKEEIKALKQLLKMYM